MTAQSEHPVEQARIRQRRAIEALRCGVPNRDAVQALGSTQPRIEERFRQQLDRAIDDIPQGRQTPGLLIAGEFGTGKSHLLQHLQHIAHEQRFVSSRIVISKATPLFDPGRLYRAALETGDVPGRRGSTLTEVAASIDFQSHNYAELSAWLHSASSDLDPRFAATLYLFEHVRDDEIRNRLISFWSGDPLRVSDLRTWLREQGKAGEYTIGPVSARDLALQRFQFAARLVVAAGYAGWVLLFDEVELISRYSFRRRARSYAEMARWAGKLSQQPIPGLSSVFAITSDFTSAVLEGRDDIERIPGRLRATESDADAELAQHAERGMRFIARDALRLSAPGRATIERTYEQIRSIHAQAYGWEPPDLGPSARRATVSMSMRQYVRRWINEWDLLRLDPSYQPRSVVTDLAMDYSEEPGLEGPPDDQADRIAASDAQPEQ
ncbi:MAG: DUF2791 family P-loop domain-containing protein [Chloroflexi bacterium]|nr:DUF2791 family P-loop domain-containing protein [Chloroflexota bacterium]